MLEVDEAIEIVLGASEPLPSTMVELDRAQGHVLAEPVRSNTDIPIFDRSQMDGYAVRASESGAGLELRSVGTLAAGEVYPGTIAPGHTIKIMTGAPIPGGADAVVPVEFASDLGNARIRLSMRVDPGTNISFKGDEIKKGEAILNPGTIIDAPVLSVLAQLGKSRVKVHRKPRVGILVTGTELVGPDKELARGKIRESNSYGFVAQCAIWEAQPSRIGQVGDDPEQLSEAIRGGLSFDILAITGGVSMGDFDLVPRILAELGVEIMFHKVAQMPGKPLLFGRLGSTLVFGLPGNPVASFFGFELYVGPAVRRLAGETDFRTMWFEGIAAERFDINSDRSVFKVARVERDGLRWIVHPKASHGSADIFSVVGSNAFARFEKGQYSVSASEKISFFFHRGKQIGA